MEFKTNNLKIGVIGLGYVGLPLAHAFAEKYTVIGYDLNENRIEELKCGIDRNNDIDKSFFKKRKIIYTSSELLLKDINFFVVSVPTPVDDENQPNFEYIISASKLVAKYLKKGDYVVYESTVYPGATEEVCLPILLNNSQLIINKDFYLGYSPERINPGDKNKKIEDIVKITSGSCENSAEFIDKVYSSVIKAGTYKAVSIKVAEAAKVIENIQRDVNIALFNEFSKIFYKIDIDSKDVFQAAATKWNFHNYHPGLVGGHCIGVDPYYMTFLCEKLKYNPKIINSGRELNDSMANYAANIFVDLMNKNIDNKDNIYKVLIIGVSFKEDCNDIRNSKVINLFESLKKKGCKVDITDKNVDGNYFKKKYNTPLLKSPPKCSYDGIILAVPHKIYIDKGVNYIRKFGKENHLFFDLLSVFSKNQSDIRL